MGGVEWRVTSEEGKLVEEEAMMGGGDGDGGEGMADADRRCQRWLWQ